MQRGFNVAVTRGHLHLINYLLDRWRRVASTPLDRHRTDEENGSRSCDRDPPVTWSSIRRCGGAVEELHDRGAIEPRSRGLGREIGADLFPFDWQAIDEARASWLTPDRSPIVARSWWKSRRKSWYTWREIGAEIKPIRHGSEATTHAQGIASMTLENRSHERFNWPRSSGQFLL